MIRFTGQRALLLDAVAIGILRQYLVQNFSQIAARAILTQFGFVAQGWRMAEAMQKEFKWNAA
ncbi:MAG: XylR N-terminal domain-containing protein [Deltaproteobacteria bacterium]|nr:XylR N-terminal domain-containing protein [Deltaproteobacteria bacterium]